MAEEIHIATAPGLIAVNGSAVATRIQLSLPRSVVAQVRAVDFLTNRIALVGLTMGITYSQDPGLPTSPIDLWNRENVWAVYSSQETSARWWPAGTLLIAGDQALVIRNDGTASAQCTARIYYTRKKVDPRLWAVIGRRTVMQVP